MNWLPIETVPKDGTLVDLWVVDSNGNGSRELDFYWGEAPGLHGGGLDNWTSDSEEFLNGHSLLSWWDPSSKLTHWMPTPKDPAMPDRPNVTIDELSEKTLLSIVDKMVAAGMPRLSFPCICKVWIDENGDAVWRTVPDEEFYWSLK